MIVVVCLHPLFSLAQPDPGGDPDVPIDGGLSILIAAGIGYAAKKGYEKRKQSNLIGITAVEEDK